MSLGFDSAHCWKPFLLALTFGNSNTCQIYQTLGRVPSFLGLIIESELSPCGALDLNWAFLEELLVRSSYILTLEYQK